LLLSPEFSLQPGELIDPRLWVHHKVQPMCQ